MRNIEKGERKSNYLLKRFCIYKQSSTQNNNNNNNNKEEEEEPFLF